MNETHPSTEPHLSAHQAGPNPDQTSPEDDGLEYFEARPGLRPANVWELRKYGDLIWILALRDLQVRYRQTLVGIAWAVVQPLVTMVIFSVLFGLLGRQPAAEDLPYALVVLCGLLPWQLFANTLTQATNSLVLNQNLISKAYFPRLVLPVSTVIPALVDFAVALVLLVGVLAFYGVAPGWPALLLPLFVALTVLTSLALGVWLSAVNAIYRDIGFVVPFLLQVGFFLTPVVYQTNILIPEVWRPLFALNPMVGPVEGFRWCLLGQGRFPLESVLLSLAAAAVLLFTGLVYFRRVERFVADRI